MELVFNKQTENVSKVIEEQFEEIKKIYDVMITKEKHYFNPNDNLTDISIEKIFYRKVIPEKGFIEVTQNPRSKSLWIAYAVSPNYRNQGIATSLLADSMDYCKNNGYECVYAEAHFQNKKSKMLLKKHSFKEAYRVGNMITFKKEF